MWLSISGIVANPCLELASRLPGALNVLYENGIGFV
jgi:hypothetical protein